MKTHLLPLLAIALLTTFVPAAAVAQTGPNANARHVEFWDPADLPLEYVIHEDGAPILTDGSDFAAIESGFGVWAGLADVELSASFAGATPQSAGDGLDGIHLVSFQDPDFNALYGSSVLAVGITTSFTVESEFDGRTVQPGQIVDADMLFNPTRSFSTDTGGSGPDLMSVTVHEAGHLFGFSHSCVTSATMFPALPRGQAARSLESDDRVLAFMAYPDPAVATDATRLEGTVLDGATGLGLPGAIVFAVSAAAGDTAACQYTLPDGTYRFVGLAPGNYDLWVHPLDGSAGANGVSPAFINDLVANNTVTTFLPEWWSAVETATDDPSVRDSVTLAAGVTTSGVDVITNVDAVAPTITRVVPADAAVDVRADALIAIEFSEAIDFDSARNNFRLERVDAGGGTGVAGSLVRLGSGEKLVFDPSTLLAYDSDYRLILGSDVQDRFGNPLGSEAVFGFRVGPAPPLSIRSISPRSLAAGALVVLDGEGFDLTDAAANVVQFGAASQPAVAVGPGSLTVRVPAGLPVQTLEIRVSTPDGQTSNAITAEGLSTFELARGAPSGAAEMGAVPRALTLLPDGVFAFVATDFGLASVVTATSAPDYLAVTPVSIEGGTDDVIATPDGSRAYAISGESSQLIVIDTDYGDLADRNPTFNTVLDVLPVDGTPLAVAVDGAGQRVFVSTLEGTVQMWDTRLGNATFHQQIGEVDLPTTPVGGMAVDRAADLLYVLTSGSQLAAYPLGDFTAEEPAGPFLVDVGLRPVGVVLDPAGTKIYVVDADDEILVLDRNDLNRVGAIPVAGSPGAFAISPAGGLGYLANTTDDAVQVIGLDPTRLGYLTVTSDFDVGLRPIDIALSPDGSFSYAIEKGSQRLTVLGIGFGPVIDSVSPQAARPGDVVVVAGSGYGVKDPRFPEIPSRTRVYFESQAVEPLTSTGVSLRVLVPDGFGGGTVRVGKDEEQVGVGTVEFLSNPAVLRGLPPFSDQTVDPLQPAVLLEGSKGYPWGPGGVSGALAVSPDGHTLVANGDDDQLVFVDVDPNALDYGQIVGTSPIPLPGLRGITFKPSGERAYLLFGPDDPIHVLNTDRLSPAFGEEIGIIDFSPFLGSCFNPSRLLALPDGEIVVVEDACTETLYCFDADAVDAAGEPLLAITDPALGSAEDAAIHATGWALYYASSSGTVLVFDFSPYSPTDQQIVATLEPVATPRALGVTPDGTKLLVLTHPGLATGDWVLEVYDTSSPTDPVFTHSVVLEASSPYVPPEMIVSPVADRALVDLGETGALYLDIRDAALAARDVELDRIVLNQAQQRAGLAYSSSPSRIFSAAMGDSAVRMTETTGDLSLSLLSGGGQSGTVGRALPSPIRFAVTSPVDGQPVAGATGEVQILGGGGSLGNGESYQWITSDENGEVAVTWVLGEEPDANPALPANRLSVSFGAGSASSGELSAVAVAAEENLPLTLAQIRPADGTAGVSRATSAQALFNRPVDRSTVATANIRLERVSDGAVVDVVYGYADGDRRVSLTPVTPLEDSTAYAFVMTAGLADLSGGALQDPATSEFETEAPPPLIVRSVDPPAAQVNTEVVIGGEGFDPVASNNLVSFGGTVTTALSVDANSLLVVVPVGATTGEIVVEAGGQQSAPLFFGVLAPQLEPQDQEVAAIPTGVNVRSIAVLPDGSKAYAASPETDTVVVLDLENFTSSSSVAVGDSPVALAAHPNGLYVYCVNWGSGNVSVLETATDTVIETIAVGEGPLDLVAAPAGDRLYVVNSADETLSVIDIGVTAATFHTVVATAPTGPTTRGSAITPDGTLLYLGTEDGYIVIDLDPSSYGVVATAPTGSSTRGAAITPDGTILFLVTASGEILVVDISVDPEGRVVATAPTGSSTRGAAITPDGSLLYVFSEDSDDILVYSIEVLGAVGVLPEFDRLGQIVVQLTLVDTFQAGRNPEFIAFDPTGSGLGIVSNGGQQTVTLFNSADLAFQAEVGGTVLVEPRTLNLHANGRFVSATLELQQGYFARNVDLTTVRLNGTVPADPDRFSLKDEDQDGLEELVVKFDRAQFQEEMPEGEYVPVVLTGDLPVVNRSFALEDTIRTVRPTVTHPSGGELLQGGSTVSISWQSPEGYAVSTVDVHVSADDGENWTPVVQSAPDAGAATWLVPQVSSQSCRVLVTLYDDRGDQLGSGLSPSAFSVMEAPVPVVLQSVSVEQTDGDALLRWAVQSAGDLEAFRVLRARQRGEDGATTYRPVTTVPAERGLAATYEFLDEEVYGNEEFLYLLEEVRADGTTGFRHGPYRLAFRLANQLEQNYPNSFNPRTTIRFSLADGGRTRLVVYDLAGREVAVLVDGVLRPDVHRVVWDGTDDTGSPVASGVYVYRLQTPGFVAARKMILVR